MDIYKKDYGRLNVLMASISSPVSSPIYYERAIRKKHNLLTFGPYRPISFWEQHARTLKSHYFYKDGSYEHWIDICSRMTKPCDIITERGMIDMQVILKRLPSSFKPDIFIWIDQHSENIPVNLNCIDCPKIALFGDTHLGDINFRLKYALHYDYVFITFNKSHMTHFKDYGCKNVFWSPAACDVEFHCKIPADKIYPVSFVGSTHPYLHQDRVHLIEFLKNNNIDIFVDSKLLQDMSLIFSRSKIVLNKSIADDMNQRVFETMASGSLLLTNRLSKDSGLEELFADKRHLVLYSSIDELMENIRYYLEHDEERERIALEGYKEVISKHTYAQRVDEIIRCVTCG